MIVYSKPVLCLMCALLLLIESFVSIGSGGNAILQGRVEWLSPCS